MTHHDIVRAWKSPEDGADSAASPAGQIDLSQLLGGSEDLMPHSWPYGTCEIGPTMGCCF